MRDGRTRRAAVAAAIAIAAAASTAVAVSAQGAAPAADQAVIVLLKDQVASQPADRGHVAARTRSTRAAQAPLQSRVRSSGGSVGRSFTLVNGFSATVSADEAERLAKDPAVAKVVPDHGVRLAPRPDRVTPSATSPAPVAPRLTRAQAAAKGLCPAVGDPAKLEPEALGTTRATQAQSIATGAGTKVAFIAEGIDVDNPDFARGGSSIFADYQDFSGDGTDAPTSGGEAFGDASAIAAQGNETYDLSTYAPNVLPTGCDVKIKGIAPGASLVGLKVFTDTGFATTASIVAALDYAVTTDHVDVINMSLGANQIPDVGTLDTLRLASAQAVAAGVTVTTSSGDAGPANTIGSPASDPSVIAVGASTTERLYAQGGFYGTTLQGNSFTSDDISGLSSSGITGEGRVIDLVAPGDLGWAVCTPDLDAYADCANPAGDPTGFYDFGGSSQSAPFAAGAAALVIQAYRAAHANASPSPAQVKQFLTGSADDLGVPSADQGAGRLDVLEAVRDAQASAGGVTASPTQVSVAGQPGAAVSKAITLTNSSNAAQTVTASGRALGTPSQLGSGTATIDQANGQTFADVGGSRQRVLTKVTFSNPAAASRLTFALGIPSAESTVNVALIDPSGKYRNYSINQGVSGYAQTTARNAQAGTWTALLFTNKTAAPLVGYDGTVSWTATAQSFAAADAVSPASVTLQPGETRDVTWSSTIPASAGDASRDVVLSSTAGGATSTSVVPVVLRSLVPTDGDGGSFSGRLTPGNGRPGVLGGTDTIAFDVPAGKSALSVALTLDTDAELVGGALVDPDGQLQSYVSNGVVAAKGTKTTKSLQAYHADPKAGRWQFTPIFLSPGTGGRTSLGYSGKVAFSAPAVTPAGVPNATSALLPAGKPVRASIAIDNSGVGTPAVFADPRTTAVSDQKLVADVPDQNLPIPDPSLAIHYLVPPGTDSITTSASSGEDVDFDLYGPVGSPSLASGTPSHAPSLTVREPEVAPGAWLVIPNSLARAGFGADPAPAGTVSTAMTAHTLGFDTTVDSSTGSAWLAAVDANAPDAFPITVAPGRTGTIDVTFTPKGADGTVVSGTLYVDTYDPVTGGSDVLAKVPYRYTIGTPAPTTTPPAGGTPPVVTPPAPAGSPAVSLASLLKARLVRGTKALRIRDMLRFGATTERFDAPGPGDLRISWRLRVGKGKRVTIASASARFTAPAKGVKVRVRLTRTGRARLRGAGKVTFVEQVTFTPKGGKPVTRFAARTLRR